MSEAARSHEEIVAGIAGQVRSRKAERGPVRVDKGGSSHLVPIPGDARERTAAIDARGLDHLLSIDPTRRLCTAGAGISFADIVRATAIYDLRPTVVPELVGITLGGAVAGGSVESSSHLYGGFHDGCVAYDIVTGKGELLRATPADDALAFEMIHGSYGTLGIVTSVTFRLVPSKPYVRMLYRRAPSFARFADELHAELERGEADFIDAIVHGPSSFVLCLGFLADHAPRTSRYDRRAVYHKSTRDRDADWLTTFDYFFRFDADCHWMTNRVPPLTWRPVRALVGDRLLGSENLLRWGKRLEPILALRRRPDVIGDFFVPLSRLAELYAWYERTIGFYPLWMVPYRLARPYPWLRPEHAAKMGDMLVDVAVYGLPNGRRRVDLGALIEEKVIDLGGMKALISPTSLSRQRFWTIFDGERYAEAKARLDPQGLFGDLYDKIRRDPP
jgi:FAD/FMN-containing dehydrogenase